MKTIKDALNIIDNLNINLEKVEKPLYECLNYTLAVDIYAQINVPEFNKSAMDGYCLKKEDLNKITKFKIVDTIYAGHKNDIILNSGECIKIMTGAKTCLNSNLVIQKELAKECSDYVMFNLPKVALNDNICKVGEDIKQGELIFKKGQLLKPICISILKSIGLEKITVYKMPKICLITMGDEIIKQTNSNLLESENNLPYIYNSNEAYIYTRLVENSFLDVHTFTIDDNINELINLFNKNYDLFLTTGAISVGDKDIVREYIQKNDVKVYFDKLNIMPGGPTCMFLQNNKLVLSLAGSPYANFVTFEMLGMTLLSKYTLNENLKPKFTTRILRSTWSKQIKKPRFVRAYCDNKNVVLKTNNHKASCINKMHECNSFIFMQSNDKIQENEQVSVYLFGGV